MSGCCRGGVKTAGELGIRYNTARVVGMQPCFRRGRERKARMHARYPCPPPPGSSAGRFSVKCKAPQTHRSLAILIVCSRLTRVPFVCLLPMAETKLPRCARDSTSTRNNMSRFVRLLVLAITYVCLPVHNQKWHELKKKNLHIIHVFKLRFLWRTRALCLGTPCGITTAKGERERKSEHVSS